jgi:hypothetical protein
MTNYTTQEYHQMKCKHSLSYNNTAAHHSSYGK